MKRFRLMTAVLCAAVLLCCFSVPAYAYADGAENDTPIEEDIQPTETTPPETQTAITPGEGFSEDGNCVTRDLLYDKATNKQFIVVQTSSGNTFYIVIDYDKPTDESGEQYQTYFLNIVDEADLLTALESVGGEPPVCSCAGKCAVGAINTDCMVCSVNMGECQGKAPEPVPITEPEPDPEPEQPTSSIGSTLLPVLAVIGIGGCAGWYFKIYRPKKQQAADAEEDNYEFEYDDTSPWKDEDDTESWDSV